MCLFNRSIQMFHRFIFHLVKLFCSDEGECLRGEGGGVLVTPISPGREGPLMEG